MDINKTLRKAYDIKAKERDGQAPQEWKIRERNTFFALLHREQKKTLLEIGAGPGRDSLFFKDQGLDVVCLDLSPEMVKLCRRKGLIAHEMDFRDLQALEGTFDAVFALNCLLHLPEKDLPSVLGAIDAKLNPEGLFYMGIYGGLDHEGIWIEDTYDPKRFFSFYTDTRIKLILNDIFDIHTFRQIPLDDPASEFHFQSITLRKKRNEIGQ